MKQFTISLDHNTIGFQECVRINLLKPITEESLRRRRLYLRAIPSDGDPAMIKKIIGHNASLRIDFGWSFESDYHYKKIMDDCIKDIIPKFNERAGIMMSDLTCSWLGFVPHNVYDREIYKDLSTYGLILYNNEIIDYQLSVIKFITNHLVYRQHAIMRDDSYRFDFFKVIRKDRDSLTDAYHFYMKSVHDICSVASLPRDILEEQIGCHFLHDPDLFFELLEFSILKGEIYG